jgi:hypothetical protein
MEARIMDAAGKKSIQWIATEIDDLSLYLRVYRQDRVADMLDEARDALQATNSDTLLAAEEPVLYIGSHVHA